MLHGQVRPGFEGVLEAFRENFSERSELGASFAVVRRGELLVDIWGGVADSDEQRPWHDDTLCVMFSGTKGLVAVCLLVLIDRGLLDLHQPVTRYWPEFGAGGKEDVLVAEAVSHRAGVPAISSRLTVREITDPQRMAELVAAEPKLTSHGEFVYHALTFGWICSELVRRIDGRSIGRFFDEEVARPLGLEAWIGLPAEHEDRVAINEPGDHWDTLGASADPLARLIYCNPPRFIDGYIPANTRMWHAAEIPAISGISDSRSLARLYACLANGGQIDQERLLSSETVELARTPLACAHDPFLEQNPMAVSIGFILPTETRGYGPESDAFGSFGAGGSCQGAWPGHGIGFSYLTNRLNGEVPGGDARARALLAALHDAIGKGA